MTLAEFSLRRYRKLVLPVIVLGALVAFTSSIVGASWSVLQDGIAKGIDFIIHMFPPDWSAFPEMIQPAFQSLVLAFLGTVFGTFISLFFGLSAASNLAPPWVRNTCRFIIAAERSLPEIIILLILIAALGLGPFAGVIALSLGCIGMLGKLFADAIEEIDRSSLESIEAVGANKLQVILYGVIPQIVPTIIANGIFRFEMNIRLSIVLGAVGAGGIGYELYHSFGLLEYGRALMALIVVLSMVFITERISERWRGKINKPNSLQ
jgi:phosphonate transport system permease protein